MSSLDVMQLVSHLSVQIAYSHLCRMKQILTGMTLGFNSRRPIGTTNLALWLALSCLNSVLLHT